MLIKTTQDEINKIPITTYDGFEIDIIAPYFAIIVAKSRKNNDAIYILTDDADNILAGLSDENLSDFESLGVVYEELSEIPIGYNQTLFGTEYKAYMSKKEILKKYLRDKIESEVGDPLDLLADLKNTQFFFQSLSARYIAIQMQITQAQLLGEEISTEIINQFNALVVDYLPFTMSYSAMIDNDVLERTADLKNRWLTRDGQIMKYIGREKQIYQLVYNYNKLIGNDVENI